MRYKEDHKNTTRRRVVEAASARFRKHGIGAVGVAKLMGDAGLTHGGFYSHFASKEALVAEAIVDAMDATCECGKSVPESLADFFRTGDLEAFIRAYLRPDHRDQPDTGCIAAALVAEISRRPKSTRVAFTKKLSAILTLIETALPKPAPGVAQALFATLMGTLQLARAVSDRALSDQILASGEVAALALIHPKRK
jgi:TetR/AcrR family transcriptional regulator, transcriptional repressor for nem operon